MKKSVIAILVLAAAAGVIMLNNYWAGRDEKNFFVNRGLPSNQNHYDFMRQIERKYPLGTPRSVVRTEFKDFNLSDTGFYTFNKDGTFPVWYKERFFDRFVYKLGIYSEFWILADYDSLEQLTRFSYYLDNS